MPKIVKRKNKSGNKRKTTKSPNKTIIISILTIGSIFAAMTIYPLILPYYNQQQDDDDDDDDDDGGGTDNTVSRDYTYDNENFTLIIETISSSTDADIYSTLTDKNIDNSKKYILINGTLSDEEDILLNIIAGPTQHLDLDPEDYDDESETFEIEFVFYDTISGEVITMSDSISSFVVSDGECSNATQITVDSFSVLNGTGSIIGELSSDVNTTILLHFNTIGSLIDSSSFNSIMTVNNVDAATFYNNTGLFDSLCVHFDGVNDQVIVNNKYNFSSELLFSFWLNLDSFPARTKNYTILSRTNMIDVGIYTDPFYDSFFYVTLYNETGSGSFYARYDISSIIQTGSWYKYKIIADSTAKSISIYLNSISVLNHTFTGNLDLKNVSGNYNIGFKQGTPNLNYLDGKLEELLLKNSTYEETLIFHPSLLAYEDNENVTVFSDNFVVSCAINWFCDLDLNFSLYDIHFNYSFDNTLVEIVEDYYIYNFTSSSYVAFTLDNVFSKSDFIDVDGNISIILNFTGNITTFSLYFDKLIAELYILNGNDILWSYNEDSDIKVFFMNETTNKTIVNFTYEISNTDDLLNLTNVLVLEFASGIIYNTNVTINATIYDNTNDMWINFENENCSYLNNELILHFNGIAYDLLDNVINDDLEILISITFTYVDSEYGRVYFDYINLENKILDEYSYSTEYVDFIIDF